MCCFGTEPLWDQVEQKFPSTTIYNQHLQMTIIPNPEKKQNPSIQSIGKGGIVFLELLPAVWGETISLWDPVKI